MTEKKQAPPRVIETVRDGRTQTLPPPARHTDSSKDTPKEESR